MVAAVGVQASAVGMCRRNGKEKNKEDAKTGQASSLPWKDFPEKFVPAPQAASLNGDLFHGVFGVPGHHSEVVPASRGYVRARYRAMNGSHFWLRGAVMSRRI